MPRVWPYSRSSDSWSARPGAIQLKFYVYKRGQKWAGPFWKYEDGEAWVERYCCADNSDYHDYHAFEIVNEAVKQAAKGAGPEQGIPAPDVQAMDSKIAFAAKKVPLEMVTSLELQGPSRVKQYGAKKHGKGNYYKASLSDGAGERYMGALLRHVSEMQNANGTWDAKSLGATDEESGLPHIDHAICTLLMLRGILIKDGVLKADPGEGKEPPKK